MNAKRKPLAELAPTWGSGWVGPYESLATLLMKFAWANAPTATVMKQMFGVTSLGQRKVHGGFDCSFLTCEWAGSIPCNDFGSIFTPDFVQQRFFDAHAHSWARALAQDEHFRFCPECLRHGYHTAVFQMPSLIRCPVHRNRLVEVCPKCRSATPPFGLSMELLRVDPFRCAHCDAPWSGTGDSSRWFDTAEFHQCCLAAFTPIYAWVSRVTSRAVPAALVRRVEQFCLGQLRVEPAAVNGETVAFWVLDAVLAEAPARDCFLPHDQRLRIVASRAVAVDAQASPATEAGLGPIYKSIRRHLQRRFLKSQRAWLRDLTRFVSGRQFANPNPIDAGIPAVVQAWSLWRTYFERTVDRVTYESEVTSNSFQRQHWLAHDACVGKRGGILFFSKWFRSALHGEAALCRRAIGDIAELAISFFFALCDSTERWLDRQAAIRAAFDAEPRKPKGLRGELGYLLYEDYSCYIRPLQRFNLPRGELQFALGALDDTSAALTPTMFTFSSECANRLLERDGVTLAIAPRARDRRGNVDDLLRTAEVSKIQERGGHQRSLDSRTYRV